MKANKRVREEENKKKDGENKSPKRQTRSQSANANVAPTSTEGSGNSVNLTTGSTDGIVVSRAVDTLVAMSMKNDL